MGIADVSRQDHPAPNSQQSEMTPIAGVVLLAVNDERLRRRGRILLYSVVSDVRIALFLVHEQGIYKRQVFCFGLSYQMSRRVSILAAIIHVHVNIRAQPTLGVR